MTIASQTMAPNSIMYVYELRYLSSLEDIQELRIFVSLRWYMSTFLAIVLTVPRLDRPDAYLSQIFHGTRVLSSEYRRMENTQILQGVYCIPSLTLVTRYKVEFWCPSEGQSEEKRGKLVGSED